MNRYMNADGTIGAIAEGTHTVVVEPVHPRWGEFLASDPAAYEPPQPTPEPVPVVISPYQARSALRRAGLFADVEAAMASADEDTRDAWEYATEWRRDSPTIATIAGILGLTTEQVDDLFISASKITA